MRVLRAGKKKKVYSIFYLFIFPKSKYIWKENACGIFSWKRNGTFPFERTLNG